MPKPQPVPKASWFDWIDDLDPSDLLFAASGIPVGIGLTMIWMAFDTPEQWDPFVSAGFGLVWLACGVAALRMSTKFKLDDE